MKLIRANTEDGDTIMSNHSKVYARLNFIGFLSHSPRHAARKVDLTFYTSNLQKLKGTESFCSVNLWKDPSSNMGEWVDEAMEIESFSHDTSEEHPHGDPSMQDMSNIGFNNSDVSGKKETGEGRTFTREGRNVNSFADCSQTAFHVAARNVHLEMVRALQEGGANVSKPDASGWTPKALDERQRNKNINDLILSHGTRWMVDEHKTNIFRPETAQNTRNGRFKPSRINGHSRAQTENHIIKLPKRVTIHMKSHKKISSQKQLRKLIILPDSLEELLRIAGKLALTSKSTMILNLQLKTIY